MPLIKSESSILVVAFFALSALYFMLVFIGCRRVCNLEAPATNKPDDPSRILRTFVYFILLASLLRLMCWLICTGGFYANDENFLKYATYERIKNLTIKAKTAN